MTPQTTLTVFRMPSFRVVLATIAAMVAVAAPASALLGLPVALPSAQQSIDTPVGSIDASASEAGANTCADLYTPALPAVPALPTSSLPIAVPAIPDASAAANYCASAGLDGVKADVGADAAGKHVGYGTSVDSPVSQADIESKASEAKGFFESLADTLFGWI